MKLTSEGIVLIKSWEGCRLKAYVCPAGKLTIGYGHTGPDVRAGGTITRDQAEAIFATDCTRFAKQLTGILKKPATDNQFSALLSFVFNLGPARLQSSTLLKKFNAGDFKGAALEFGRWVYFQDRQKQADGTFKLVMIPSNGLIKRRVAEAKLFLKGVKA